MARRFGFPPSFSISQFFPMASADRVQPGEIRVKIQSASS
jgi:hypothetical protein